MALTLDDILSMFAPNEADAAMRNPQLDQQRILQQRAQMEMAQQRMQMQQQQAAQQMEIARQREAQLQQSRAAQLQGTQARTSATQAKLNKPEPGDAVRAALGASPQGAQPSGSNQYSIEGDTQTPFNMDNANERIRGILAALSQGQAPQANERLPQMTANSLSPLREQGGPQAGDKNPFYLKGFEGQIGFNPETKAFTNIGIAPTQKMTADAAAKPQAGAGGNSAQERAATAAKLKGLVPDSEIPKVLDSMFPDTKPNKNVEKDAAYIRAHAPNFVNKETGQPAGIDSLGQDLNPDEFRKTHIELNKTQQQNVDALGMLDSQISSYEALKDSLGRSAVPGKFNTLSNKIGTISSRLSGDPAVASLDASRAQITQLARAFGGDSRVSGQELKLLQDSVISDSDNNASIDAKLQKLREFRAAKAKRLGLPWLQTPTESGGSSPAASGTPPPATPLSIPSGAASGRVKSVTRIN